MEAQAKTHKVKAIIEKLKTVKNIEIIIAIIVVAVIILVYSAVSSNKNKEKEAIAENPSVVASEMTEQLETQLAEVLSNIDGAGKVKVMISFDGSTQKVIANTVSTHTSSTGGESSMTTSTTNTETPTILSSNGTSEPYVLEENLPDILGVIVVAEGATSAKVRLELMRAVQTALKVNASNIEIFAMK